jgi:hypothetical protein
MKRNTLFLSVLALAMLVGLALSSCEFETLEDGIGTIKLKNNSQNVMIVYWSLENSGKTIWEGRSTIYPGNYATHDTRSAFGIQVYLEDNDGDGWLSKNSYTVRKDETVEVKFPSDFSFAP